VFQPLVDNLRYDDPFQVLADYADYMACQQRVSDVWIDQERWTRMSVINSARGGTFSSDRSIREYCDEIWHLPRVPIALD
jgi:starch phosphorylase